MMEQIEKITGVFFGDTEEENHLPGIDDENPLQDDQSWLASDELDVGDGDSE